MPRIIDLCAGIGGMRKGFELTGHFENVLSAETDKFACMTYEHLYGNNPLNDITTEEFKQLAEQTEYEILLAGFPCQTFSRAGLQEGFNNEERGVIFNHIVEIIQRTRPQGFFLENVDHLITHNQGETFQHIIDALEIDLNYKVIGVNRDENNNLIYDTHTFIRNSRYFGVPQNRPRAYIMGFDREHFNDADEIQDFLPQGRDEILYASLTPLLERRVDYKYYMSQGYYDTLVAHRARQARNGNGFGFKVINAKGIENPVANTLLATGGSGKERNLVRDTSRRPVGRMVGSKTTPINDQYIRVLTPTEWGKLQGFINYAFINTDGDDEFDFPEGISDAQKYKQFGNSVTIPVIESMAGFMVECLRFLGVRI